MEQPRPFKILLVHDDPQFGEIVEQIVAAGVSVEVCHCLVSAVLRLEQEPFTLLVVFDRASFFDLRSFFRVRARVPFLQRVPLLLAGEEERISPFENERCEDLLMLPLETREIVRRVVSSVARLTRRGVRGALSDLGLVEVLQLLLAAGRTGLLEVTTPFSRAELLFRGGQLVSASTASQSGEEVLRQLLKESRRDSYFLFDPSVAPPVRVRIEKRTDHLLLALASSLDEEDEQGAAGVPA